MKKKKIGLLLGLFLGIPIVLVLVLAVIIITPEIDHHNNTKIVHTGYKFHPAEWTKLVGVMRISTKKFAIGYRVVDYNLIGNYLVILRMVGESVDCINLDENGKDVGGIVTHRSAVKEYYFIDYKKHEVNGPYDESDLNQAMQTFGIPAVDLKIPEDYSSNTASFTKRLAKCHSVDYFGRH